MALTTEPRNDLHLTSTGVGHSYQESMKFPPDGFKVRNYEPSKQKQRFDARSSPKLGLKNFKFKETLLQRCCYHQLQCMYPHLNPRNTMHCGTMMDKFMPNRIHKKETVEQYGYGAFEYWLGFLCHGVRVRVTFD